MSRPNILIFMTDHQRGDTVLAEHPAITPNVSRLGEQGLTLTNAYCPAPHCCPARATFFSGLYPSRHGVWNNVCNGQALNYGLNPDVKLWSEDLAEAGYAMAYAGKWHVSAEESPADRGWRELAATSVKGTFHGQRWDQYRRIAARPDPTERGEGQILRPGWGTYTLYGSTGEELNGHDETALDQALDALPALAAGDDPWALYVGAIGPHDPYLVPQKYLDMYDVESVPLPPSTTDTLEDKPRIYKRMRDTRFGQLSERELREGIRHFWAYCTYLDDMFWRLLAALDATGQADNTIVLYCSDHGDYCGDHGLFAKGIPCFRGAYHVPAVIRWPDGLAHPGRRADELVSLADFAPTFLEAAGVRTDRRFTGASLIPIIRGKHPDAWRDEMHTQCNGVELYYTQRSVMTADYKYVFNGFDNDELYDLTNDPHEMRNLADHDDLGEVKRDMVRRMWRFARREQDTATNGYITVGLAPFGPADAFR